MSNERSHPKCPTCEGNGYTLTPSPLIGAVCPACQGSGELPAVPYREAALTPCGTFRDAQTATVVADLAEERDRLLSEVQDWRDGAAKAAATTCDDERHCACVPELLQEVERLAEFSRRIDEIGVTDGLGWGEVCDAMDARDGGTHDHAR